MMADAVDHRVLAGRFNATVGPHQRTRLIGGAEEPLYLPARADRPALIRYARDHARSVLHELAHWLLAGPAARSREDYGLWYSPPPRSPGDQARFYRAEVPVQALEMLLCLACGVSFRFSADNPGADDGAARWKFEHAVRQRFGELWRPGGLDGFDARTPAVLAAFDPDWRARLAVLARQAG